MASGPSPASWRAICAQHLGQLAETLERQVDAEVRSRVSAGVDAAIATAVSSAANRTRREVSDQLNQAMRRLRQCTVAADVPFALADAARPFAERTAAFTIENQIALGGTAAASIRIPLAEAPAFRTAVETRDPVVALGMAGEVSARLVDILNLAADEKVYLFPVVLRQEVSAVLCAAGAVVSPAVEALAGAAALHVEALGAPQETGLVTISGPKWKLPQGTRPAGEGASTTQGKWWELTAEERQVHLSAQRFARVRVAEMRLNDPGGVREGRARLNLYGALQEPIDAARDGFRKRFVAATPTMVDYLHLELLRSLGNDDPLSLGPDYPGPLA